MHEVVESNLKSLGWSPERRITDEQLFLWLKVAVENYGAHIFPKAIDVLRNYGGLILGPKRVTITPMRSGLFGEPELWMLWEWEIGEVLFPIAYDDDLDLTFAISTTGKVYARGVVDCYCGDSFEAFLEGVFISNQLWTNMEGRAEPWTDEKDLFLTKMHKAVFA